MGVTVDEAGNGYHAGAVDNGLGAALRGFLGDGADLAVFNGDEAAEEDLHFVVHGHYGDIGNQSIHNILLS